MVPVSMVIRVVVQPLIDLENPILEVGRWFVYENPLLKNCTDIANVMWSHL